MTRLKASVGSERDVWPAAEHAFVDNFPSRKTKTAAILEEPVDRSSVDRCEATSPTACLRAERLQLQVDSSIEEEAINYSESFSQTNIT